MTIVRTTFAAGARDLIARMVSNYRCGHCNGEVAYLATTGGELTAAVEHNDGCPVLAGVLPVFPDLVRAAGIPDTFRPGKETP
ncbi:hypothetical protein OG373_06775 [Streptomyces avidinii]|uniref:hypothetical protein n=1 Tax=Streptomyces avidinii TaxID=1895 RepID=UPI003870D5CE|nr:hypothetical protein OG373_06775 [Streptomyces avidinii]